MKYEIQRILQKIEMLNLVVTSEQSSIPSMTSVLYSAAAKTLSAETDVKVIVQSILDTILAMTEPAAVPAAPAAPAPAPAPLKTEDTGKIFEKAICDSFGIPYDGPFKYSQDEVNKLVPRLSNIVTNK